MADDGAIWRTEVSERLQESANAHKETAVILERLKGQLDGYAIRLGALETMPGNNRANINTIVAVAGVLLVPLMCVGGPVIGALVALFFQQLGK